MMPGCDAICIFYVPENGDTHIFRCDGWLVSTGDGTHPIEIKAKSSYQVKYVNAKSLQGAVDVANTLNLFGEPIVRKRRRRAEPDEPRKRRRRRS